MFPRRKFIAFLFFIFIIVLFSFQAPVRSFKTLYVEVPDSIRISLEQFRRDYPVKELNVNDHDWIYLLTGEAEETILFLHGMGGAYDIWWQQIGSLRSDYQVLSVTYPPVYPLEKLASDILAIMDHEGIQTVNLVGTSLGGYLAQYMVQKYPERIEKTILGNTFPPGHNFKEQNRILGALLPFLPEWMVLAAFRKKISKEVFPASGYSEITKAYLLEQTYGKMSKSQFVSRYYSVLDTFQVNPIQDHSLLIIESNNDPLVPETLRDRLKTTYPQAESITIIGNGHFPYINNNKVYTEYIKNYLKQIG